MVLVALVGAVLEGAGVGCEDGTVGGALGLGTYTQ